MFISHRTTRQRESKKLTSDTSTTATSSVTNTFSSRTNDVGTTNATNTVTNSINTTPVSNALSTANAQVTNHSQSPSLNKEDTPAEVQMDLNAVKEEKDDVPVKKAPATPKGKYDLRPSTLVPRDYGTQLDDPGEDGESGDKKKVEAVIDLTEDDEEVPKISKPESTKTTPPTDGSGNYKLYCSDLPDMIENVMLVICGECLRGK